MKIKLSNIKSLLTLWGAVLLLSIGLSSLANAEDINIVFVDGNEILSKYQPEIGQRLQAEFADQQQEFVDAQQELESMVGNYQRDEAILSPTERQQSQHDIEGKQLELQRLGTAYQDSFALRGNEELEKLELVLGQVVNTLAEEQGYDIVLQQGAALYRDTRFDITDTVMDLLEQALAEQS